MYHIEENFGGGKPWWRIWRFTMNSPKFYQPVVSEIAIEAGLKFAKVCFANCNLACNLPNFSPTKVFIYPVCYKQSTITHIHHKPQQSLLAKYNVTVCNLYVKEPSVY